MGINLMGIRFIFDMGSALDIVLTETECKTIIDGWLKGELKPIIGNPNMGINDNPNGWAVRSEMIRGICMLPLQPQGQVQPATPQQFGTFNASGLPIR